MSAMFFLIRKMLKNIVRSAFRKPAVLIGYIAVILFFGAALFGTIAMPSGMVSRSSPDLFKGIVVLVFIFLYYFALKLGIDKGSSYFRMSDVNLAFTAPIRPNHILLYGFLKQIGGTLLLLFFAMFQIPNLKNNFIMRDNGILMILLAVAGYAMSYPLIGMILYTWASKAKRRKKLAKNILDGAVILVAVYFVYQVMVLGDFAKAITQVFGNPIALNFPIIGWASSIAGAAVDGITTPFIIGASGMGILLVGLSIALYKMNLDYYEDVLEATEYMEAAVKAKREGRNMTFNMKVKQNVRQKLSGMGARAIFAKHMLEIRKTAMFLFVDRLSITVILSSLVFKFIMPSEMQAPALFLILCFSVYMLLLIQAQGRWTSELDKHYIYMIPATPFEKMFYATLGEHFKNLFDGTLLFVIAGIVFQESAAVILACIASYVIFGAVFTYTDVLARRIFGGVHSKGLLIFIKVFSALLIQIPGIIAVVLVGIATGSQFLMVCAFGGWSLILAITFFIFASTIFNNLEAAG